MSPSALLYDVQGPSDDGSCYPLVTPDTCLSRTSPFDSSQSYCAWTALDSVCSYQDPQFSFKVVVYIAVLVALMVSMLSYPIDVAFDLLTAPEADEARAASQESALLRVGRRMSNAAASFVSTAAAAVRQRASMIAGSAARHIPSETENAHALAVASMTVLAGASVKQMQQRQLARMRAFHEAGGRYASKHTHDDMDSSDSSDSNDSDSNDSDGSESDASHNNVSTQIRGAETSERTSSGRVIPSRVSVVLDPRMAQLSQEVQCQRRMLRAEEKDGFDRQWGLDPVGDFCSGDRALPCFRGEPGAVDIIAAELRFVARETALKVQKLGIATDQHTGLEILHLFIQDLLGRSTPAALIFETKSAEDFKHTRVVTKFSKFLAMLALVLLNAFFASYAVVTGFRKGVSWQRMYLFACVVQIAAEVFVFETMECGWINCVIPSMVSSEVREVGTHIAGVVQTLCSGAAQESRFFLHAPDYLFVSTGVAKSFPGLMESILVQAYSSHLPGELSQKWQVGALARQRRRLLMRNTTLLAGLLSTLQYLGTAPFILHRMFIRFLQPFVFSALVLCYLLLTASPILLGGFCALLALLGGYAAYRCWASRQARLRKEHVSPLDAQYQYSQYEAEAPLSEAGLGSLHLPVVQMGASSRDRAGARAGDRAGDRAGEEKGEEGGEVDGQDGMGRDGRSDYSAASAPSASAPCALSASRGTKSGLSADDEGSSQSSQSSQSSSSAASEQVITRLPTAPRAAALSPLSPSTEASSRRKPSSRPSSASSLNLRVIGDSVSDSSSNTEDEE
ncbi:hypothetical protein B484DRAFT_42826 [Ochromonadaceae sp. CCMP2298]|nr:hypothetical protein B484DRAFT_42826 [Ochromonadaceae sp. CCMP2298]